MKVGQMVRIVRNVECLHHFQIGATGVISEVDKFDSTIRVRALDRPYEQWVKLDDVVVTREEL